MQRKLRPSQVWPLGAAALLMWSCSDNTDHPAGPDPGPSAIPLFGASTPANGGGACMGDDSWAAGLTPGMQSASDLNCTSNDIEIALASVSEYRFTDPALPGGSWTTLSPGGRIECTPNQDIWVRTSAELKNNATARYDVGIWIGTQGQSDAKNGQCSQYNLVKTGAGVSDLDGSGGGAGDACGDMSSGTGLATIDLDVLKVTCTDPNNNGTVEVPACIGWQNQVNGPERVCATNDPPLQFRYKTTPDNKAKCNCDPLVLPIDVRSVLRIKKVTVPAGNTTDFTFTPTGWNSGSTFTRKDTEGAFASAPLASGTYSVAETVPSGWTLTNRACVLTGTATAKTFTSITNGVSVDLANGEDVTCTFTNTKQPRISVAKVTAPTTDGGKFDFSIGATPFDNSGAGFGHGQNTGFQQVAIGAVTVSESAHTGTTLSNYSSTLACINAADQSVTVSSNTGTSGSVTVAAGDDIRCTFTNTRLGTMILKKVFVGTPVSFSFTGTGPTGSIAINNGTITVNNVTPGTYTSDETPVAGWILSALDCDDANSTENLADGIATYRVEAGETVTCTYTNTELATLIISKVIGGSVSAITQFGFSAVAGTTPSTVSTINLAGGQTSNSGKVLTPGTYTVCEVNVPVALDVSATLDGSSAALTDHDPQASATNLCLQVALSAGQTRTVVYTNSLIAGEGGTRTIGYWKNWSSCTGGNQYDKAVENDIVNLTLDGNIGAASSIYPLGLITASDPLECLEAFNLLSKNAMDGTRRAGDPIYNMVAQLLGAKLNQNAGAAQCPAVNDPVTGALKLAQDLLVAIGFNGTNTWPKKGPGALSASQITSAQTLAGILGSYNEGTLGGTCPTHV